MLLIFSVPKPNKVKENWQMDKQLRVLTNDIFLLFVSFMRSLKSHSSMKY